MFSFIVLLAPVVLVFGSVKQRAALRDCRSAARVLVANGWSARRIRTDRKASAPYEVPLSRPNSVLGTPKNKKSDSSFPTPDNNRIFSGKKVSAVSLLNLNSSRKLEVNTGGREYFGIFSGRLRGEREISLTLWRVLGRKVSLKCGGNQSRWPIR